MFVKNEIPLHEFHFVDVKDTIFLESGAYVNVLTATFITSVLKNANVSRFYCLFKTMKTALPALQMSLFPFPAVCRSLYGLLTLRALNDSILLVTYMPCYI